jgi:hypothetical protein
LPPGKVARASLWLLHYNADARGVFDSEVLHMTDVTRILSQIESGDPSAAEKLLPLVYDELRKLAAAKMAQEKPDQTLQATELVHEAHLRLVDVEKTRHWNSRGHFAVGNYLDGCIGYAVLLSGVFVLRGFVQFRVINRLWTK